MGKSVRSSQVVAGLNRGAWTSVEDKTLIDYVKSRGEGRWSNVAKLTGLRRCGKSCRLRWMNYLRPDIKRGNISLDEEELILRLHKLLGNRWALIAGRLPGRTDNEIKNYWNTHLLKKAQAQANQNQSASLFTGLPSYRPADINPPPPIAAAAGGGNGDHHQPQGTDPFSARQNNNYDRSFLAPTVPTMTSPDDPDFKLLPNGTVNNSLESDSSDRSSSLTCGDVDDSHHFMIDFNIDEIYQILDPEFGNLNGVVLADLNIGVDLEEESQCHEKVNAGGDMGSDSDLRSLASFLESEEWLGDGDHVTGACNDEQVGG